MFGSTPIEPNVFLPDITAPSVLEWFVDSETKQINIAFNEPVIVKDITGVTIWESLPITERFQYSFDTVTSVLPNPDDPKVMIATIKNRCITDPSADLSTCTGSLANLFNLFFNTEFPLYITASPSVAEDRAENPNPLLEIIEGNPKIMGAPDCSPCTPGFYLSKACTSNSDRECKACTTCRVGTFAREVCTITSDTRCQACSYCTHGHYIYGQCTEEYDTVCRVCDTCDRYSYTSVTCENGMNTVCSSCLMCDFFSIPDPVERESISALCNSGYYQWWALENCCTDLLGRQVSCADVGLVNLEVDAITGRHHWSFNPTSPKVPSGFELGRSFSIVRG